MVEYVVEALLQARGIRRVLVVGPAAGFNAGAGGREGICGGISRRDTIENIKSGLGMPWPRGAESPAGDFRHSHVNTPRL